MNPTLPRILSGLLLLVSAHAGEPFHDTVYHEGRQRIPGPVFCAYYDLGGEGIAYHDSEQENQGSGKLNPVDGSYLNEFRRREGIDISYTKQLNDLDSPCNKVTPPLGLLYVGWNSPGEWFNLTVDVDEPGDYSADVLYTAQRDAGISISVNGGTPVPMAVPSTFDPAETISWRQWHHWNVARDGFTLKLPKGVALLTVRIESGGNLNLATFAFHRAGSANPGPDITAFKTRAP